MANGRPALPFRDPDEELYRRFDPEMRDGSTVHIDAIELPDMSVNRSSLGPAKWALLVDGLEHWGVAAFKVGEIPPVQLSNNQPVMTLKPVHCPHKRNYPHSEVQAFRSDGSHISLKQNLDPEPHLLWRERLTQVLRIAIQPSSK